MHLYHDVKECCLEVVLDIRASREHGGAAQELDWQICIFLKVVNWAHATSAVICESNSEPTPPLLQWARGYA